MYPSRNTRSRSTASKESLYIFPKTSPTSPSLSKSDLNNNQNDIKSMTEKHHYDMKTLNDHIYAMLTKVTDTSSKIYKQEEELIEISSKLSNYEDLLKRMSIK